MLLCFLQSQSLPYFGNDYARVQSIDTSGGIACSRTSGQVPCFVQVSASAIAALGGVIENCGRAFNPYEDLHYSWDFGDPDGTETVVDPRPAGVGGGGIVNLNTGQTGPEAAYCYRVPGIYTVELTIRARTSWGVTERKVLRDITVSAFNASGGTYYFDSAATDDSGDGLTPETAKKTLTALNSHVALNRVLYLKRGSAWTGTFLLQNASNVRVLPYGVGDQPIIEVTAGSDAALKVRANGAVVSDIVFQGINPKSSSATLGGISISDLNSSLIQHVYLDNVTCQGNCAITYSRDNGPGHVACGIWGGTYTRTNAQTANPGTGFYAGAKFWNFIVGPTFTAGVGGSSVFDHHIYSNVKEHALYLLINFVGGQNQGYSLNINYDCPQPFSGTMELARWYLISRCDIKQTSYALDAGTDENASNEVQFRDFVVQHCAMHDLLQGAILPFCVNTMTVRDTTIWNNGVAAGNPNVRIIPGTGIGAFYRNKMFRAASPATSVQGIVRYAGVIAVQQFTDNIIQDNDEVATCMSVPVATVVAAGALIDRNQYWGPNRGNQGLFSIDGGGASGGSTLAQWKAAGVGHDLHQLAKGSWCKS